MCVTFIGTTGMLVFNREERYRNRRRRSCIKRPTPGSAKKTLAPGADSKDRVDEIFGFLCQGFGKFLNKDPCRRVSWVPWGRAPTSTPTWPPLGTSSSSYHWSLKNQQECFWLLNWVLICFMYSYKTFLFLCCLALQKVFIEAFQSCFFVLQYLLNSLK